jgi:hypothetical protein
VSDTLRDHPDCAPTTVGTARGVEERLFTDDKEECTGCGISVDRGQRRRFVERYAVFGVPI